MTRLSKTQATILFRALSMPADTLPVRDLGPRLAFTELCELGYFRWVDGAEECQRGPKLLDGVAETRRLVRDTLDQDDAFRRPTPSGQLLHLGASVEACAEVVACLMATQFDDWWSSRSLARLVDIHGAYEALQWLVERGYAVQSTNNPTSFRLTQKARREEFGAHRAEFLSAQVFGKLYDSRSPVIELPGAEPETSEPRAPLEPIEASALDEGEFEPYRREVAP